MDDTELDSPLLSSTESFDLCGTSATITSSISATLISELDNHKLEKGCLEHYEFMNYEKSRGCLALVHKRINLELNG